MKKQALRIFTTMLLVGIALSLLCISAYAQDSYADPVFGVGDSIIRSDIFVGDKQGRVAASEGTFTRQLSGWLGDNQEVLKGEVVQVGQGCNTDTYLANPAGKIALIERGACSFVEKLTRAYNNGAIGAIVYNSIAGVPGVITPGEFVLTMNALSPCGVFTCPGLVPIPGFFIARSHGLTLAATPVTVKIQAASFKVLKDAVKALAQDGTLSNPQAGALKDIISAASDAAGTGNFATALSLIVQFRAEILVLRNNGVLTVSDASELRFTAAILAGRLQPPFTNSL